MGNPIRYCVLADNGNPCPGHCALCYKPAPSCQGHLPERWAGVKEMIIPCAHQLEYLTYYEFATILKRAKELITLDTWVQRGVIWGTGKPGAGYTLRSAIRKTCTDYTGRPIPGVEEYGASIVGDLDRVNEENITLQVIYQYLDCIAGMYARTDPKPPIPK